MGKSEVEIVGKPQGITGAATLNPPAAGSGMAIDVDHIFTYHPPVGNQPDRYASIREGARVFAHIILNNTKPSADQTAAIRLLSEAMMTANKAISLER